MTSPISSLSSLPILPKQGELIQQGSTLFDKGIKTSFEETDENDSKLKEEHNSSEETDYEGLKEVLSALVEKGVEMIPGVGELLAPIIGSLLGNLMEVSDDQKLMQKSLDRLESKIDGLDKLGKENMSSIMSSDGLKKLQEVSAQLNDIWARLKEAERTGDVIGFKKAIESIDSDHSVSSWLRVVDTMLLEKMPKLLDSNGNQINKSSLEFVQSLLQDRVQSETNCSNYTVMKYEKDIQEWLGYVSEVQIKGAALRIIYQKSRIFFNPKKVSVKVVEGMVKEIVTTYQTRIASYNKALLGHILDYPSSKLLKVISQNDSNLSYPRLFALKHEGTGLLFKVGYAPHSSKPILLTSSRGISKRDSFAYKGVVDSQDFSSSFGLTLNEDGRWSLRGSRFKYNLDHSSSWNVCRDDQDKNNNYGVSGEDLGLFGRNFASFKIIPLQSSLNESPLVTLVLLDKDGNRTRTWNVRLQDSVALPTLSFYRTTSSNQVYEGFTRRSSFTITNYSQGNLKNVLVFQEARTGCGNGEYGQFYTPGLVWLPDHAIPIVWAAETQDSISLEGIIKIRSYRLKDGRDPSKVETVQSLLHISPSTGKLSLKEEGATPLEDIFIKVWNPSGMSYNAVSSATRWCDHSEGDLPVGDGSFERLQGRELKNTFDEDGRRATQNDTKEAFGGHVALKYTVSGGARQSSGWVDVRPRW